MSSTNKTENLKLNSWLGSDIPKREDFNSDNTILDSVISGHINSQTMHISQSEKTVWNTPYYMTTYFGNGSATRTISLSCDFNPSWGIVFRISATPSVIDIANEANYNYFGLFSKSGSQSGLAIIEKSVTVTQSSIAVFGNEYRNFNENGRTYVLIAFR